MRRLIENIERLKVNSYIYLWESFHKSNTLKEFEEKYLISLYFSIPETQRETILKQIVIDFYAAHGTQADLIFLNDQNKPIVVQKKIQEQENIFTHFLIKNLNFYPQLLHKAQDRDDICYINLKDLNKIAQKTFGETLLNNDIFHIYRVAVRKIFELDSRDAIFFNQDKLIIKFFNTNRDQDRRFNGVPEEKLMELYTKLKGDEKEAEINAIFSRLIANELNFKKIDNFKFHATYIKLFLQSFQKLFADQIKDKNLLVAFSQYFLRSHFKKIVYMLVDELYSLIPENDENVKNFINFYDGKEIIVGQKRIKKSEIIVDKERYSYYPIYKVAVEKLNIENIIEAKESEIREYIGIIRKNEHTISSLTKEMQLLKNNTKDLKLSGQSRDEILKKLRLEFQEIQIKLLKCKDSVKKESYENRLDELRSEIDFLSQIDMSTSEILIDKVKDINNLAKEIDKLRAQNKSLQESIELLTQKIKEHKEILMSLQQKEDSIKEAIANAIIKFRV